MIKRVVIIACIAVVVITGLAVAGFGWLMFGDHSHFETGLAKSKYLPPTAHDINIYTNPNITGWFVCDFSMNEEDFKKLAEKQGWNPREIKEPEKILTAKSVHDGTHKEHKLKNGLYYSKRAPNGGGVTVGYDRDNHRGYIEQSSR